jgi:hypothetical protein
VKNSGRKIQRKGQHFPNLPRWSKNTVISQHRLFEYDFL